MFLKLSIQWQYNNCRATTSICLISLVPLLQITNVQNCKCNLQSQCDVTEFSHFDWRFLHIHNVTSVNGSDLIVEHRKIFQQKVNVSQVSLTQFKKKTDVYSLGGGAFSTSPTSLKIIQEPHLYIHYLIMLRQSRWYPTPLISTSFMIDTYFYLR